MHKRARTGLAAAAATTAVLAAGVTAAPAAQAAEDGPAPVRNRVLVVIAEFKDAQHVDTEALRQDAAREYFDGSQSIAGYYTKVSQGAFTYVPAAEEKVVGPYTLDLPQKPCDAGAVNKAAREAAAAAGYVEKEDYDSISVLQPGEGSECGWLGLGSMPGPNTWLQVGKGKIGKTAMVHEFGHNQGFNHHKRDECPGGDLSRCTTAEGHSGRTPMGGGGTGVGFVAPELISKGWLPGGQAVTVEKSATFTLKPLYGGAAGGVRALDIPLGDGGKDRLVVEYRHEDAGYADDENGNLDADVEGVHAYLVPEGDYNNSRLLDPTPGTGKGDAEAITSLTDAANKVGVKVVKSGGGSATVSVSLGGVPAPAADESSVKPQGTDTPAPQPVKGTGGPATEHGDESDAAAAPGSSSASPAPAPADHTEMGGSGKKDLAATGGSSATPVIAGVGALLAAAGALCLFAMRRRGGRRRA
ncbi:LAETG motif-containing sortase-dependent surface protein [Streptomyces sp. NPDC047097]|uniref:LAETG motif-containing sortase-dependent surface protein n=1 Tax=Streptomyces sp. NPDC047097 TaxID=3155260 RepID=UPI0033D08515